MGGEAIAPIYCPLCDSVTVVDRRLGGETYEFGISGLLCYSNVLLYDRTDKALWAQLGFQAVSGPNAGKSLSHLGGWQLLRFAEFQARYPDATVLSMDTGHGRIYDRNPYTDYFATDEVMRGFQSFTLDERFKNKARMVGIQFKDTSRAYLLDEVRKAPDGVVEDTIKGAKVRLQYEGELDALRVLEAPDQAKVAHTFWFAWAKFHPQTQLFEWQ